MARAPPVAGTSGRPLGLAAGCDLVSTRWSDKVSFTVDRDRAAVGQVLEVTFDKLADEDGRRSWITVVPEETSRVDQLGRIPIPRGAHTMRLGGGVRGACVHRIERRSQHPGSQEEGPRDAIVG